MAVLQRLQWIDQQIRAGAYPNTRGLAAAFEISRVQAQRDFEYLRDRLGAPLRYSARHRGYHYTTEAFVLPGPYITREEQGVLADLAAYYAQVARRGGRESGSYGRMAGLISRMGGLDPEGPADLPAERRHPYRAILRAVRDVPAGVPYGLEEYCVSAVNPKGIVCEFYDPESFLAAMLIVGGAYRLEFPNWLRERLLARLTALQQIQL